MNKRIGTHTHTVDIITLKSVLMGEDRFMACQKPSMNSMPNSFGKVYGVSVGSTQYLSTADFPRSMNAPEHSNRHADARICGLLPVCTRCTKTFIQEENDSVWYSDYFANIAFNRYYANYCTMNLTYTSQLIRFSATRPAILSFWRYTSRFRSLAFQKYRQQFVYVSTFATLIYSESDID